MPCASVWQMKRDGGRQRALFAQQLALAPLMYIWDAPPSLPSLPPPPNPSSNPSCLQQRYRPFTIGCLRLCILNRDSVSTINKGPVLSLPLLPTENGCYKVKQRSAFPPLGTPYRHQFPVTPKARDRK
jgi:hypothetical protein